MKVSMWYLSARSKIKPNGIVNSLKEFLGRVSKEEVELPLRNGVANKRAIAVQCGFSERNWSSPKLAASLNDVLDQWLEENLEGVLSKGGQQDCHQEF